MTKMHPTTWAIATGLRGSQLPSDRYLAGIALLARRLADEFALPDRDRIIGAAEAGWDLGIGSHGTAGAEITAGRVLDGFRLIVTARHRRDPAPAWTFFWSIQPAEESSDFSIGSYASGSAVSFAAALDRAIDAAGRRSGP